MVDFKVGDVIMLNSGGPAMTVTEIKGEYVCAAWFDETSEPKLHSETLFFGTFQKIKQ